MTAGGDGLVKLWQLGSILAAAAAAAAADGAAGSCQLEASAEVLLPHLQNPLGVSDGRQPAAQALAVDQQHQQVFIGEPDVKGQSQLQLVSVAAHQPTELSSLSSQEWAQSHAHSHMAEEMLSACVSARGGRLLASLMPVLPLMCPDAVAEQLGICGYVAGEWSSPSWVWAWVSGGLNACVCA